DEKIIVGGYASRHHLPEPRGELLGVASLIAEQVLLVARNRVDAGEKMVGVGAERSGRAGVVSVSEEVKLRLAARAARVAKAQEGALVAVVVIRDHAPRVEPGEVVGPTEAARKAAAAGGEAARGEAAPFRQRREARRTFAASADDVDDARDGVRAVKRALRPAGDFHAVHSVDGERSKVEVAAKLVDLDAVDHDQVVVGVAAANENDRLAAATARMVDCPDGNSL